MMIGGGLVMFGGMLVVFGCLATVIDSLLGHVKPLSGSNAGISLESKASDYHSLITYR
jgi:hypothetical protein